MLGSKNRQIELAATLFYGIGTGIVVVLSSNLLILFTDSTLYVGLAEGLPAILPLLVAFPAGVWFDKSRSNTPRYLGLSLDLLADGLQAVAVCSFGMLYGFYGYWVLVGLFMVQFAGFGLARGWLFCSAKFQKQSGKIRLRLETDRN